MTSDFLIIRYSFLVYKMARRMKIKIHVTQLLFFLKRFLTREMDLMWNLKKKYIEVKQNNLLYCYSLFT